MKAKSSNERNAMSKTLLDYGFMKVKGSVLYNKDSQVGTINIDKAKDENIKVFCKSDIILIYENTLNSNEIYKEIVIKDNISLPIKANDEAAYLIIKYNNDQYKYPLYVKEDVEMLDKKELIKGYIIDILF